MQIGEIYTVGVDFLSCLWYDYDIISTKVTQRVWAFHGLNDTSVSPSQTIETVKALEGRNLGLKYDLYEGEERYESISVSLVFFFFARLQTMEVQEKA